MDIDAIPVLEPWMEHIPGKPRSRYQGGIAGYVNAIVVQAITSEAEAVRGWRTFVRTGDRIAWVLESDPGRQRWALLGKKVQGVKELTRISAAENSNAMKMAIRLGLAHCLPHDASFVCLEQNDGRLWTKSRWNETVDCLLLRNNIDGDHHVASCALTTISRDPSSQTCFEIDSLMSCTLYTTRISRKLI